jgi:hypothetical protein
MCADRYRSACAIAFVLTALTLLPSPVEAQATGRIIKNAPMYLLPDASRQPLLVMEAGALVEVHRREGGWLNVTVEGSQMGRRTGYVDARLIEVFERQAPEPPRITAATAIPPRTPEEPISRAAPAQTQATPTPAATPRVIGKTETFQKSRISMTVDDRTRESDVIVRYEPNALVIVDKKTAEATKTFPYAEMKGAEYSYSKNPRWKTAIFVSPLFLFTSGKKHWFLVQGESDYALLHLDKSNYRLILAAFEARTGLKIETVADTK